MRPKTRAECRPVRERLVRHLPVDDPYRIHAPCPFVGCRFHLHADVGDGGITLYERSIEHTCALDIADKGATSHEAIAEILGLTAEGVRLAELRGVELMRASGLKLAQFADDPDEAQAIATDARHRAIETAQARIEARASRGRRLPVFHGSWDEIENDVGGDIESEDDDG